MTLVRNAKQFAAVAAAFAGLSLTVAYAAPNYEAPALSPLDATSLNSTSPLLNNFNQFLGSIEAKLTGKTLAFPNATLSLPTDLEFYEAVAAAVAEAPLNAEQIVSAAVQYKPAKTRDIVKNVVLSTPGAAEAAVAAAARAVPTRAADAAAGAIFGLIEKAGTAADMADAADEAVIAETRELIEKVAKAAVAATKALVKTSSAAQGEAAVAVAEALVQAYSADAASSNARLFADDIARGIVAGVNSFIGTDKSAVATAIMAKLVSAPSTSPDQVVNFAMGALKSANLVAGTNGYDSVEAALVGAAGGLTGALAGVDAAIAAGAKAQKALRGAPAGLTIAQLETIFKTGLTAGEVANIGAYVSGAVQALKGKAPEIAKWALEDPNAPGLSLGAKQSIVAAAVTGNFGATAKVVAASITALGNNLSPSEAVAAAIPASTNLYSGAAVTAGLKQIAVGNPAADSQAVLHAAINAAVAANYHNALTDIVLSSVKVKKIHDNDLVATAIANVPSGWEEAVAAIVIANNSKDKPDLVTGKTNAQAAIDAATAKAGADVASVTLAISVATGGKLSPKTLFDDAIEAAYANPNHPRAILFGAGAVNSKLAAPLLGMLLRLKDGGDSASALRDYAVSLNKKGKLGLDRAYEAAVDAIASEDNIFDIIDHKILTNPKQAVEILSAVVAARPEYAHFAARAAAFRSPATVGKTALAAIQFAHMRSDRTAAGDPATAVDDPAAVAAISAAVVLGIKDAGLSETKEIAAMKAAIAGLVKGAMSFQNSDPLFKKDGLIGAVDFEEATGAGDSIGDPNVSTTTRAKGSAAVLTGAVAQLQVDDASTPENELEVLNTLAGVAISAAAKAAKAHSLALAQAAGAAAAAAAAGGGAVFGGFAAIASAFLGITGITATQEQLENAARFGADQFANLIYGAGAAGILNYSHRSGGGTWISDISNF